MNVRIVYKRSISQNWNGVRMTFLLFLYWEDNQYWFRVNTKVANASCQSEEIDVDISKPALCSERIKTFLSKNYPMLNPVVNWYKIIEKERLLQMEVLEMLE